MTLRSLTEHHLEFLYKFKRRLQRIVWVYTCPNTTLLEITCCSSYKIEKSHPRIQNLTSNQACKVFGYVKVSRARFFMGRHIIIWAATCYFQQCSILIWRGAEPVQPPFKLRNSKWWSVSSLTLRIFKRLAKALIRLQVCAGWSEALLVA